jgi:RHS repeat-associated protein
MRLARRIGRGESTVGSPVPGRNRKPWTPRVWWVPGLLAAMWMMVASVAAETRQFLIEGSPKSLDRSQEPGQVEFRALRPSRVVPDSWTVDVVVRNRGKTPLLPPLVLSFDQQVNVSRDQGITGVNSGGVTFINLSSKLSADGLAPGAELPPFTITMPRGSGVPSVAGALYAKSVDLFGPVAVAQSVTTDEDAAVSLVLSGTDADGDALTFTVVTSPSRGVLTGTAPNLTYTPNPNAHGTDRFTFKVNDGRKDSSVAAVTVLVRPVNDVPGAAAQTVAVTSGAARSITLTGSDVDGDVLSFAVVTPPTQGVLSGTAPNLTYTSNPNATGADNFTFKVNDGQVDSPVATVGIEFGAGNRPPVAIAQTVTADEDIPKAITLAGSDADGNALTHIVVSPPNRGTLSGTVPNLTYTPNPNAHGADSFTFKVNDGTVDSPVTTVSITVRPVNDVPVAAAQTVAVTSGAARSITLAGSDVDGDTLSFAVVTPPTQGVLSGTAPNLTYTSNPNATGADNFTFKVNDGRVDSPVATVAIEFGAGNRPPVAIAQTVTADEDIPKAITLAGSDADGNALTHIVVSPPNRGTLSGTVPNLTYTPNPNAHGADSFTFKVNDGTVDSPVTTVSITVRPVNDVPVAAAQTVAVASGAARSITLAGSDVDGDALSFAVVTPPTQGVLSGTAPNLTYTANPNATGADNFTFKVNDGQVDSPVATVAIDLRAVADPPSALTWTGRVVDEDGIPLDAAEVQAIGSEEASSTPVRRGGWFSVPVETGIRGWRISAPGRHASFRARSAVMPDVPDAVVLASSNHVAAPAAFELPSPLPAGWTPLVAGRFPAGRFELGSQTNGPVSEGAAVVAWDEDRLAWRLLDSTDREAVYRGELAAAAVVARIRPDVGLAGTGGAVGTFLDGPVAGVGTGTVTATGRLEPPNRIASTNRSEVLTRGFVEFRSTAGPLPSGTAFRCEVRESYELRDGSRRVLPAYTMLIRAYRVAGADAALLRAEFPLRPTQLLSSERLAEARVEVDVLDRSDERLRPIPAGGTVLQSGLFRLGIPAGMFPAGGQARLTELQASPFDLTLPAGVAGVAAFDLDLPAGAPGGTGVSTEFLGQTPGTRRVLARVVFDADEAGFQPLLRLRAGTDGVAVSEEPAMGGLRGMDGGGRHVVFQLVVAQPQVVVRGTARNVAGVAVAGMVVRSGPWTALTDADGRYELLVPAATATASLTVTDRSTGDVAQVPVPSTAEGAVATVDVDLSPRGPFVVASSPVAGATAVARVSPVVLTFSRPLNPGTVVVPGAVVLAGTNGVVLPAAVSINPAGDTVTLLPTAQLPASAPLRVVLSTNLQDRFGRPLEGTREIAFTTEGDTLRRADAVLTIYEPLDGLAGMSGGAGLAEPNSPVVLVNETTGETATVISRPDGSFTNSILARIDDELVAVLVNANGTRNRVRPSSQVLEDGSVALFDGGGTVTADGLGGPVSVTLGAGSSRGRTVIRLSQPSIEAVTNGVPAPVAFSGVAAALDLRLSGDSADGYSGVAVPFDVARAGVPLGVSPTNMTFALAIVRVLDGVPSYQVVDGMRFRSGMLVTDRAEGFPGWLDGLHQDTNELFIPGGRVAGNLKVFEKRQSNDTRPKSFGLVFQLFEQIRMVVLFSLAPPFRAEGKVGLCPAAIEGQCLDAHADPLFTVADQIVGNLGGGDALSLATQVFSDFGVLPEIQNLGRLPLPGAIVDAAQISGPFRNPEDRFTRGLPYAVSDRSGRYHLLLPSASEAYVMRARHPSHRDRDFGPMNPVLESGLLFPVARRNFTLIPDTGLNVPPVVRVTQSPLFPGTNEPVELRIDVIHAFAPTATVSLVLQEPIREIGQPSVRPPTAANLHRTSPVRDAENSGVGRARFTATVSADRPLVARFRVTADVQRPAAVVTGPDVVPTPLVTTEEFQVQFAAESHGNIPIQSDPLDRVGPSLVRTEPVNGGMLAPGEPIRLFFNEPIDAGITNDTAGFSIQPSVAGGLVVGLSADQTVLEILPPFLQPDTDYAIRYLVQVSDLSGNPLQNGTLSGAGLNLRFRTPVVRSAALPGINSGGGAVSHGSHIFALDRAGGGRLVVFDASRPMQPVQVAALALPGFPRDLEFIPDWSYYVQSPLLEPEARPRTHRNLLLVVGGTVGTLNAGVDRLDFQRQYLRVYDVTDPKHPERVASSEITAGPSTVQKVTWHPPEVAFFENGADLQQIAVLDLQAFIIAYNTPIPERRNFPDFFVPGLDGSGLRPDGTTNAAPNGNYTDVGDVLPQPDRVPVLFHAQTASFGPAPLDGGRRILDYDYDNGFGLGVITFAGGASASPGGLPLKPGFRVAYLNGPEIGSRAEVLFNDGARPKRVFLATAVNVGGPARLDLRNIAFVSLAPDADGKSRLAVIDVTDPLVPVEVNATNRVVLPAALGLPQSLFRILDGRLALAMTTDALVLDPALAFQPHTGSGLHPMFRGSLPRAGGGNQTLWSSSAGIMAPSLGSRSEVIQVAPALRIVQFLSNDLLRTNGTGATQFVGAQVLRPQDLRNDAARLPFLRSALEAVAGVGPASVQSQGSDSPTLLPPTRPAHYYVMMEAPGGAGAEVLLGLQSLNRAGLPLRNKGRDFPAVRAVSAAANSAILQKERAGCDAPIREFRAFRLSDDPASDFYNLYLSEPFAVTGSRLDLEKLKQVQESLPRVVLWSAFGLSAFIDPSMGSNPVLGPYAAQVTGFNPGSENGDVQIRPRAEALAETWPATYLPGDSPPPVNGKEALPGTFGMVNADNGEIRHETTDLLLPGRGMPIAFSRHYGGQDLHEGPFGHGWDFFHNQQVVPLRPQTFGYRNELILAVNRLTNAVGQTPPFARSGDLLFADGEGHLIPYTNAGGVPPPEVASDPLVQQLGWRGLARTFYLPSTNAPGVFDPIFEFQDGAFARLTPAGEQFWYDRTGRLTKVYDAHAANFHELVYNERSDLIRIIDRSIPSGARFLEIGYFRLPADRLFNDGLDARTSAVFVAGKIARLRDNAGRTIDFLYDGDGILKQRIGIAGAGANNGSSARPVTEYLVDGCGGVVGGIIAGGEPNRMDSALFASNVDRTTQKVGQTGNGVGGPVAMSLPGSAGGPTQVTGPDGAVTEMRFDARGYLTERVEKSPNAGTATNRFSYNRDGQLTNAVGPLGDRTEYVFDLANPVLRARANLLLVRHVPGSRGGPVIERSMPTYDLRYNLPVGVTRDFNGFNHTITLTADGRDVGSIVHQGAGETRSSYNEYGQLLTEDSPDGVHVEYRYGSATGFTEKRIRGANETGLEYDSSVAGRLGHPTTIRPPVGAPANIAYDARLLPTSVGRGGSEQKFGYDANGNMVYRETKVGALARRIETREYNRINFLEKVTVKNVDVRGAAADIVTRFVSSPQDAWRVRQVVFETAGQTRLLDYDHFGRVIRNALGAYVERTEYDLNGNPVSFKQGDVVTRTMAYDGHDRLTNTVNRVSGTRTETMARGYHPGGELRSLTISDSDFGEVYKMVVETIDSLGRPRSRRIHGTDSDAVTALNYPSGPDGGSVVADGPRDRLEIRHDAAGFPAALVNHLANATYSPDGNGNVNAVLSSEGGRTYKATFAFNSLDQLDRVDDDLGLVSDPEPRLDGSNEKVADGRGNVTTQEFSILGELRQQRRGNGVEFNFRRDANRQLTFSGDAAAKGHTMEYDRATTRPTVFRLRSDQSFQFNSPNFLNLPGEIVIPGGRIAVGYDDQGRTVSRDAEYAQGLPYKMTLKQDALGRVRVSTYGTNGANSANFRYDLLGPLTGAIYTEAHGTFAIAATLYPDGSRQTVRYPSGLELVEERDPGGRLLAVRSQGGGDLYRVGRHVGVGERGEVDLGDGLIREVNRFDLRRQNTARAYTRGSDGSVLADIRYRYDAAGNIVARQEVHRHGRADVFAYDDGNRLVRADIGLRPPVSGALRHLADGLTNAFGLAPGQYARIYQYDGAGLDLLQSVGTVNPNPLAVAPIPFVTSLADPDPMLFPTTLDGVARGGPDPLGNTIDTRLLVTRPGGIPARIPAALEYTAFSQLAAVRRSDGVQIAYEHHPDGLVHHRSVSGAGIDSDAALVWDNGRLIEEYERAGSTNVLKARYLYADEDSPFAADFRDPLTGDLHRYWYLRDALSSVVALADESGTVVERYRYESFGEPVIEGRDGRPPRIAFVAQTAGSLLVQFSEPVLPRYRPAAAAELPDRDGSLAVEAMELPRDFIRIQTSDGLALATVVYEEDLPGGFPFGALFRVTPLTSSPLVGLVVAGGALEDEWGNGNIEERVTFSGPGGSTPLFEAPGTLQDSRPPQLARSAVGSPMLFHGQYWDAEAGLLYLRARFYDPGTGMFLQQDPVPYVDSPNSYAGFANAPTSRRDPSGTRTSNGKTGGSYQKVRNVMHSTAAPRRTGSHTGARYQKLVDTMGMRARQTVEPGEQLRLRAPGSSVGGRGAGAEAGRAPAGGRALGEKFRKETAEFIDPNHPDMFERVEINADQILIKTKDGYYFNAGIDEDGNVSIEVNLVQHMEGPEGVGIDVRSMFSRELGGGRENYELMFSLWGDRIRGWNGILVDDNFAAIRRTMPAAPSQADIEMGAFKSVTGEKFWKPWMERNGLKARVRDAQYKPEFDHYSFDIRFEPK